MVSLSYCVCLVAVYIDYRYFRGVHNYPATRDILSCNDVFEVPNDFHSQLHKPTVIIIIVI